MRAAERLRAPAPGGDAVQGVLHRKCAGRKGGCASCDACKEEEVVQRYADGGRRMPSTGVPPIVHETLASPGRPLDGATRAFMESHFAHDFSRVRVHTGERAASSARAVDALAYTVGPEIVFDSGQYAPGTQSGRGLLAHELTHVVQQEEVSPGATLAIGGEHDAAENEADRVGADVTRSLAGPTRTSVDRPAGRTVADKTVVRRSKKGVVLGAIGGALAGAVIGGLIGGIPGAILGGLAGGFIGALIGAFVTGSKVSVDKSCDSFCPTLDVAQEAKKTDAKADSGCKEVVFTYQVAGEPHTRKFDSEVDLDPVTVRCNPANVACGGWSSKGVITLGKGACNAATCGPLASSILHEMVHDWAGWGPPFDKQNVTVPGASHAAPDYLDEWVARYAEKECFGYDPWGLP